MSLYFGNGRLDAVGGVVAPEVKNVQGGLELPGDRRSSLADDKGRDARSPTQVLVHLQYFVFIAPLGDGESQKNGLGGRANHGARGKIVSGAVRSDGFPSSLGEAWTEPASERCEDLGKSAHVQVEPLRSVREPLKAELCDQWSPKSVAISIPLGATRPGRTTPMRASSQAAS
jgi:hypothetical protein